MKLTATETAEVARAARLLSNAPFAVIEFDRALRLTAWNEAATRLFETAAAEAIGAGVEQVIAATDANFWRAAAEGAGEATRVATHVRADGVRLVCEWTAVGEHDAEGGLLSVACYGRDITEHAAKESTARLEGAMLRAITENLSIIVWTMEADGLCTYHQGKGLANIGQPQHAFVGLNIREMYRNLDAGPLDRVFEGKLEHTYTQVHDVSWENWLIPIRGEGGAVELLLALSLDVTEQRQGEEALREKLQQIEQQQQMIRALSTPIIEIWDHVLTAPIVGTIDSTRAAELMDNLLQAVARTRARFAILDLTGVEEVDTDTAGHLLGLVRAIRLLGAEGVITGIHPNIARTIVTLGLETSTMTIRATLREALKHCMAQTGRK